MESLTFKCGHPRDERNSMPRTRLGTEGMCCRTCKAASNLKWRRAHPEWQVEENRKVKKLRVESLMETQKGLCAICERRMNYPYEDHRHSCCPAGGGCVKCRRGLLCPSCNGGLHLIEDERLHEAANAYLKFWE